MNEEPHVIIPILQALATIAPAIYTASHSTPGFTFAYTHVAMPPLSTHAPPKLLAKQWLQAYQFAPKFVAPLIVLSASSNALLSYFSSSPSPSATATSSATTLYAIAALANASIIPYTALYMEPGINGAGKCKVRELLRDEGFELKASGQGTYVDTAGEGAKRWARGVDMKTIVETWARVNAWRYAITAFATIVSAIATVARG